MSSPKSRKKALLSKGRRKKRIAAREIKTKKRVVKKTPHAPTRFYIIGFDKVTKEHDLIDGVYSYSEVSKAITARLAAYFRFDVYDYDTDTFLVSYHVEVSKKKPCNYRGIFETIVPGITGHYNVSGVKKLSKDCLAALLENQLKRGAVRFRIWYKVEASPQYPNGLASSEPFWYTKLQGKGGALGFLNRLDKPIKHYWFRTKDFRQIRVGDINLHGIPGHSVK